MTRTVVLVPFRPPALSVAITRIVAEIAYRFSPQHLKTMEANVRHVLRATRPELAGPELDRLVRTTTHRIFWNRGTAYADNTVMATRRNLEHDVRYEKLGNWAANWALITPFAAWMVVRLIRTKSL